MPVYYNNKKIIPAPFFSCSEQLLSSEDGKKIGVTFQITLSGTLVSSKGSPDSNGAFWTSSGYPPDETLTADEKFESLLTKSQALRNLFSEDGKLLEIQPWTGSAPFKCNPRIISIDIPTGRFYEEMPYSITFEADSITVGSQEISGPNNYKISRSTNQWSVEVSDEELGLYRVIHSVNVTGKRYYDSTGTLVKEAWENARDYALTLLGLVSSRMIAANVLDLSSHQAYNYLRSQSIDEFSGSFTVNETWLAYNPGSEPPAIDQYEIDKRTDLNGIVTVSVNGTIKGLQVSNNTDYSVVSTRWTNANSKWNTYVKPYIFSRAETISGITLNPIVLSQTENINQQTGVITYSSQYNNRKAASIPNAKLEKISVDYENPADVFAEVTILARANGPILQPIGTVTKRSISYNIEAVMGASTYGAPTTKPDTDSLVSSLRPVVSANVFVARDTENWDENEGRYSRSTTFTWSL